eukprot:5468987-Amphidinium_carterae.1
MYFKIRDCNQQNKKQKYNKEKTITTTASHQSWPKGNERHNYCRQQQGDLRQHITIDNNEDT